MYRRLIVAGLIAIMPRVAAADEVVLRGGGRLSGRIVERTATSIAVDVGPGVITVSLDRVVSIDERRTPLHEYHDRVGRLADDDAGGWVQLGRWASAQGLNTQANDAFRRALAADPQSADANTALGRVNVEGRWVSEDDAYRLRGFEQFEGRWMPAADVRAVLERRDRERADRLADLEAARRVREADARAAEAEARAREAEAAARAQVWTVPLWWGTWSPAYTRPGHQRAPDTTPQAWPPLSMWPSGPLGVYPSGPLGLWSAPSGTVTPPGSSTRPRQRTAPPPSRPHEGGRRPARRTPPS
ncbi:MAG: hypothetical protein R2712_06800 [Vicinamibacterales bacterium]